jgi:uncharacterized protein (DUF58 family)
MSSQGLRESAWALIGFHRQGGARSLFFNRMWIYSALIVIAAGAALRDRGLVTLGALVTVAALVTASWNRASLERLRYTRTVSADRFFPCDRAELVIELYNDKPLPVPWLTIDEEMSDAIRPLDRVTVATGVSGRRMLQLRTHLGPYERVRWRIPIELVSRGVQTIGPATLRSGDPLGFFSNRIEHSPIEQLLVFPRMIERQPFRLPSQYATGDVRVPRHMLTDPLRIIGVRDYRPDDPLKAIHWKASARQGILQVRIAEPTTTLQLIILVNIDTFNHYWEGLDVMMSEAVIEIAASVAMWAIDHRYSVGLGSNGIPAGADQPLRVKAGRGPQQQTRLLEGLARLSPYSTVSFGNVLHTEASRLLPGSTLVIVTSLLPEGLTDRMKALIGAGHRVVLVPAGDCPVPVLRGLSIRRLHAEEPAESSGSTIPQPTHG